MKKHIRTNTNVLILFLLLGLFLEFVGGNEPVSSFQGILLQVTEEKLEELRIQKDLMSNYFNPALKDATNASNDSRGSLQILYNAVKNSPIKDIIDNTLIETLKNVLQNSETDPSVTTQLFSAWSQKIQTEIQQALRKCQYSYYFGALLGEWLEAQERKRIKTSSSEDAKKAKEESIKEFSKIMFSSLSTNDLQTENFSQYVDKEFFVPGEVTDVGNIIKQIRKEASEFLDIEHNDVTTFDVQSCIKGLLTDDLLSESKKTALKELSSNPETLAEVASLLTNRLKNIDRWEWPNSTSSVPVDLRRGLDGEYAVFLNEDILTALFLQMVGVQWAAFFKQRLLRIYNSKMWKRGLHNYDSIEAERDRFHQDIFLSSLPDSVQAQENRHTNDYFKVQSAKSYYGMQQKLSHFLVKRSNEQVRQKKMAALPLTRISMPKSDIDTRQQFLHALATEIRLHQVIHSDKPLIVVQVQIDTFGETIKHEAALVTMEKFGVPKQWLEFFKKFLQPSLIFASSDAQQKVLRGIPASHAISNLMTETLLFVLESIVNTKCDGMKIYRISDEFWFWNKDEKLATQAWQTINEFGVMVGLKINIKRSGSAKILAPTTTENVHGAEPLPKRNIHWGYLELSSEGTFKIDQNSTTKFLGEMKTLLGKADSTLEWIQIFNKYMVFFVQNFGKSALVFGKQHLDQITSSLRAIHTGIFGSLGKSPVNALKERFVKLSEMDLLDAWIYWPLEMGGLGLTNPFIEILALRRTFEQNDDDDVFRKIPLQDKILWDELNANYEKEFGHVSGEQEGEQVGQGALSLIKRSLPRTSIKQRYGVSQPKNISFEEYIAGRETQLSHWYRRYLQLLEPTEPQTPVMPIKFAQLGSLLPGEDTAKNYFMWLYNYCEPQLELYFGTSNFINSGLLPKSIIASILNANLDY